MAQRNGRKIFVNLPVRDLERSKDFFAKLGFAFNPQFTDDKAACMVVSPEAYVMLLREPFFRTFTKNDICDTTRHTEGLFALSCDSRGEVDEIVRKAVAHGGRRAMDPIDHGFMYGSSFYDPDGHHWEVLWMDPAAIQEPADAGAPA
jgi:predicted lactoylglutathione lyase